ncbi:MAG: hypothetical protein BroJett003_05300 [Planctomycetota bacterium]|nr:MAG: hypothetical protein BroJett003_05300 [Planctomycetota bacterium]
MRRELVRLPRPLDHQGVEAKMDDQRPCAAMQGVSVGVSRVVSTIVRAQRRRYVKPDTGGQFQWTHIPGG